MNDALGADGLPFISVVIPSKNGEGRIEQCIKSLNAQTYPKEKFEVIVADGRSSDGTREISERMGAKVVDNPGITPPGGHNAGIDAANGDYIAFVDDDCILPPDWLMNGQKHLEDKQVGAVGGPTPIPEYATAFSKAVFALFRWASMAGYSVQSDVSIPQETYDIPGGNSMLRAEVIKETGRYREDLPVGEDVNYHWRIKKLGYNLLFAHDFVALHNKRDAPRKFLRQMIGFSASKVMLSRVHNEKMRPLHWMAAWIAPISAIIAVIGIATAGGAMTAAVTACGFAVLSTVALVTERSVKAASLFPLVVLIFVIGWCLGFFREILFPSILGDNK